MLCRISSRTRLSQPGRADSGRFLQTSQTDEAKDVYRNLTPPRISVAIGKVPVAANPAWITAETSVSQATGSLLAKTTTRRPSSPMLAAQAVNERAIPSSYAFFDWVASLS